MRKMTCSELTKLGFQDFAGINLWLSGYYNAGIRNTVIDLYQFAHAAKTAKDFCRLPSGRWESKMPPSAKTRVQIPFGSYLRWRSLMGKAVGNVVGASGREIGIMAIP